MSADADQMPWLLNCLMLQGLHAQILQLADWFRCDVAELGVLVQGRAVSEEKGQRQEKKGQVGALMNVHCDPLCPRALALFGAHLICIGVPQFRIFSP